MNPEQARIVQFEYFNTLFSELCIALVAKKGKLTPEDVEYIKKQGQKVLETA